MDMERRYAASEMNHSKLKQWREERIHQMKEFSRQRQDALFREAELLGQQRQEEIDRRTREKQGVAAYHQYLKEQRKQQDELVQELAFKEQAERVIKAKAPQLTRWMKSGCCIESMPDRQSCKRGRWNWKRCRRTSASSRSD
jgi:hypothetical protein